MRLNLLKILTTILALSILYSCSSGDEITKKKDEALNQKGNVVAEMLEQARQSYLTALEKQKEGKRRMKQIGSVEVPQEAFLSVFRTMK